MAKSTGIPELSTVDVIPIIDVEISLRKYSVMGRVYYKSPVKISESGEVTYMFFYLLDQTAEIRAVAFGNAMDLRGLYDKLEINEVYCISGDDVQMATGCANLLENRVELIINDNTSIKRAQDSVNIPYMPEIEFQSIAEIKTLPIANFVNVIGVCNRVSDLKTIPKPDEPETIDLELIDKDGRQITLTVWREEAHEFNLQDKPVIAARNVKVYFLQYDNLLKLNFVTGSMLFVNPKIPEAIQLRSRFDNSGDSLTGPDLP